MGLYILLFLAVLPSVVLGYIIYKKDRIEKESSKILIKLLLGGVGSVFLTLVISLVIFSIFPFFQDNENLNLFSLIIYTFICVALVEEGSKWIFMKTITWKNKEFSHIYDAIVYATFVSMGFATLENIIYIFDGGLLIALVRAVASVPGHVFFGICMGYYYGLSKQAEYNGNMKLVKRNLILSILVPTILHGFFDYCLFSELTILFILFIVFVIFLYIKAFKMLKRMSNINSNFISKETSKYCFNCGTYLKGEFCHNCGSRKLN